MNSQIIELFANDLAKLIHKPAIACKGLIRFAITDYFKKTGKQTSLGFEQFMEIVNTQIKERLRVAKFDNIDSIIESLKRKIVTEQGIFTMNK